MAPAVPGPTSELCRVAPGVPPVRRSQIPRARAVSVAIRQMHNTAGAEYDRPAVLSFPRSGP
jgi:hypothetical protein